MPLPARPLTDRFKHSNHPRFLQKLYFEGTALKPAECRKIVGDIGEEAFQKYINAFRDVPVEHDHRLIIGSIYDILYTRETGVRVKGLLYSPSVSPDHEEIILRAQDEIINECGQLSLGAIIPKDLRNAASYLPQEVSVTTDAFFDDNPTITNYSFESRLSRNAMDAAAATQPPPEAAAAAAQPAGVKWPELVEPTLESIEVEKTVISEEARKVLKPEEIEILEQAPLAKRENELKRKREAHTYAQQEYPKAQKLEVETQEAAEFYRQLSQEPSRASFWQPIAKMVEKTETQAKQIADLTAEVNALKQAKELLVGQMQSSRATNPRQAASVEHVLAEVDKVTKNLVPAKMSTGGGGVPTTPIAPPAAAALTDSRASASANSDIPVSKEKEGWVRAMNQKGWRL
jgi:hypothetical protein